MEGRLDLISAGELIDKEARINELRMLKTDLATTLKRDETFINRILFDAGDKYEQGKMDGLTRIVKEIDSRIAIIEKSL